MIVNEQNTIILIGHVFFQHIFGGTVKTVWFSRRLSVSLAPASSVFTLIVNIIFIRVPEIGLSFDHTCTFWQIIKRVPQLSLRMCERSTCSVLSENLIAVETGATQLIQIVGCIETLTTFEKLRYFHRYQWRNQLTTYQTIIFSTNNLLFIRISASLSVFLHNLNHYKYVVLQRYIYIYKERETDTERVRELSMLCIH